MICITIIRHGGLGHEVQESWPYLSSIELSHVKNEFSLVGLHVSMRMVKVREKVFRNSSYRFRFDVSFVDCTSVFVKSVICPCSVCKRDGDLLLRTTTLEDELHTRVPLLFKTKLTSILPPYMLRVWGSSVKFAFLLLMSSTQKMHFHVQQ